MQRSVTAQVAIGQDPNAHAQCMFMHEPARPSQRRQSHCHPIPPCPNPGAFEPGNGAGARRCRGWGGGQAVQGMGLEAGGAQKLW